MKREFLEGLGLEKETVDKIMAENGADLEREKAKTTAAKADLADVRDKLNTTQTELDGLKKAGGDIADVKKQLTDLQTKYDTDTKALQAKIDGRDYSDAISAFIAENGLKFSSKSAERAFIAAFKEKGMELKDGKFIGTDEFLKSQQEADPGAFITKESGFRVDTGGRLGGGGHTEPTTLADALMERYGKKG